MDNTGTHRLDNTYVTAELVIDMEPNSRKGKKGSVVVPHEDVSGKKIFLTEMLKEDSMTQGHDYQDQSQTTVPQNQILDQLDEKVEEETDKQIVEENIMQNETELENNSDEQDTLDVADPTGTDQAIPMATDPTETHVQQSGREANTEQKEREPRARSFKPKTPVMQSSKLGQGQSVEDCELGIYNDDTEGADLIDNDDYEEMLETGDVKESGPSKSPDIHGDRPVPPPTSILRNPSAMQELVDSNGLDDLQNSRVTWNAIEPHFSVSISNMQRHYSGRKANTPASFYSSDSRNASRVNSESREAMFRRAMTLLSARCTSTGPNTMDMPFGMSKSQNFGVQAPQYFYVRQDKPRPMPPLKAWNGYNGNVYFEPIQINTMSDVTDSGTISALSSTTNDRLHRMLLNRKQMSSGKFDRVDSATTRSLSRQTAKSSSVRSFTQQALILDKKTVMNGYNENIQDDLALIEGVECTGSLAVRPKSDKTMDKETRRALMYNKDRICKGSVVHRMNENRNKSRTVLKVNGGKFVSPQTMSPLLRTQTQYSLSNQRLTTNSPDPYHQQLPPLEQLRASVRHMDNTDQPKSKSVYRYSKPVTMTEEIKPFIKYSPEVKNKRQPSYV